MKNKIIEYTRNLLNNTPDDWIKLTTHRLDIYDEKLAKDQFLNELEKLFKKNEFSINKLKNLPTAYDYIRLGHPLSSTLEWVIAKLTNTNSRNVISFSSRMIPIMSILRSNLLEKIKTRILYYEEVDNILNFNTLDSVYNYNYTLCKIKKDEKVSTFEGSTIIISQNDNLKNLRLSDNIDFHLSIQSKLGSIIIINGEKNNRYISKIQHMRRRETIAMTPKNSFDLLNSIVNHMKINKANTNISLIKQNVLRSISQITKSNSKSVVASSGLSMQYAIMMGLIDYAQTHHTDKKIKFIVPVNCYGGTNDQARRVVECIENVEIIDLLVDGKNNMADSINIILDEISCENTVPFIITEIPTNPRVEVPDLKRLRSILGRERFSSNGDMAVSPVFIIDQTFCPNYNFLGKEGILSDIKTISYVSGSKFPSAGKCTGGYCIGNNHTIKIMDKIEFHLNVCDNEATDFQYQILSEQMPSMNQRIKDAYLNTLDFVNYIKKILPEAKINFVSKELSDDGFTPSVFSLDLPTKGNNSAEKEEYKRKLNLKLIDLMINELPNENKYCVSYGQLNGCYWTIPATSTQGTTKESDKDYIARVSISPNLNLKKIKKIFKDFVNEI